MAPETIVAAVAANATWKMKVTGTVSVPYWNAPSPRNQPSEPKKSLPPTEGDRVADREEGDGASAEVHQVLHHDVGDALGPCEPGFDEREARLHEDHEHGGQQHEHVVEVLLDRLGRLERAGLRQRGGSGCGNDRDGNSAEDSESSNYRWQHGFSPRWLVGAGDWTGLTCAARYGSGISVRSPECEHCVSRVLGQNCSAARAQWRPLRCGQVCREAWSAVYWSRQTEHL